ncbi:AraC family transcriptional regulator [Gracilibacillus salinarum]|uniref:AraC family transcriptional regulator n=1 Tax=Gracilibacillus salinarum TaxID=2932255 RepID=A0ABY4GRI0_9BACI|nr:AraC family transcriptional regulator [Gracilibacillus salinarum]UOQ86982.1 AraC family transcriptional regulator [Gracilibacillus salinarum]
MEWTKINDISPLVRKVKITKSDHLSGEWTDFDHVFTYIEQGTADFILNGINYKVQEGDSLLFYPKMRHFIRSTSEEPLIQYIFHFDLYFNEVRSKWKEIGVMNEQRMTVPPEEMILMSSHPISNLSISSRIELRKCFLKMYQEYVNRQDFYSLRLKAATIDILSIFYQNQNKESNNEGSLTKGWGIIEKCINFIQDNYDIAELDSVMIGEYVGFSASHISFLFKEQLGVTLHNYITHVRIENAKKLMLESDDTITMISEQTGYKSIYSFSRSFKKKVGMTASQYIAYHSNVNL